MYEKRYVIEMSDENFDNIPSVDELKLPKTDYYFNGFRIRKFTEFNGEVKFFRVDAKYDGLVNKRHTYLGSGDNFRVKMESCLFKIYSEPKILLSNGYEVYIERVSVIVDDKIIFKFFSGEIEDKNISLTIKDIGELDIVDTIEDMGITTMRELVLKLSIEKGIRHE